MAITETSICNAALALIGAERIASIDDTTARAIRCKDSLPIVRKQFLEAHFWSFARWRETLAINNAITPEYEFTYVYNLPNDYIRLRSYNGSEAIATAIDPIIWLQTRFNFLIEGGYLLTNDGEVVIGYNRDIVNPALWSTGFFQVVRYALASELAFSLNKDNTKAQALMQEAMQMHLPLAVAVNSQEDPVIPYAVPNLYEGRW